MSGEQQQLAPDAPDTPPMAGAGAYVLGSCLHSSASADIYQVHAADAATRPRFPLLMKLSHAGGPGTSRFLHAEVEQQVLPRLHGVHVPRVVDILEPGQAPRLVMEQVQGRSLQSWLDAAQRPASDEVLRLGVALAQAVHEVHRQHAVHHDLQPAHVIIRPDGRAVLLGWGRAWHAQLPDLLQGLGTAQQMNSAAWLAPEQVLGQRGDPRSDVFAIGVILYQLLTGVLPLGAPRHALGLHRRLWQMPVPLRRYNPALTYWLEAVVQRCLEPEASARYPSAAHLAFDLLHPQALPAPASRLTRGQQTLGRWWHGGLRALGMTEQPVSPPVPGEPGVPIVLLALSPEALGEPQTDALRQAVRRAMGPHRYARLLCVTVMPAVPESDGKSDGISLERRALARLRLWSRPLGPAGREAVCRVLAGADALRLLLDCARDNEVSDIVLCARDWPAQLMHRLADEARCSVLLVRPPAR